MLAAAPADARVTVAAAWAPRTDGLVTMTSLELVDFINSQRAKEEAELTHANFLAKVPKVLGETSHSFECDLPDSYGRPRKGFRFPKREACLMAMSYSYELQAKVYDRMTALEAEQCQLAIPNFSNPAEAARAWAEQYEQRQAAQLERDKAIATKAEIGSRREATAMATASAASREVKRLQEELGHNQHHATMIAVEKAASRKFGPQGWRPVKKWCDEHGVAPKSVTDPRYGEVKAWPADAWGTVYGIDLAEIFPLSNVA